MAPPRGWRRRNIRGGRSGRRAAGPGGGSRGGRRARKIRARGPPEGEADAGWCHRCPQHPTRPRRGPLAEPTVAFTADIGWHPTRRDAVDGAVRAGVRPSPSTGRRVRLRDQHRPCRVAAAGREAAAWQGPRRQATAAPTPPAHRRRGARPGRARPSHRASRRHAGPAGRPARDGAGRPAYVRRTRHRGRAPGASRQPPAPTRPPPRPGPIRRRLHAPAGTPDPGADRRNHCGRHRSRRGRPAVEAGALGRCSRGYCHRDEHGDHA